MTNELLPHDKVPDAVLTVHLFPDGVEYDIKGDASITDHTRTVGIIFRILIELTRPK
jgi:hypothetical protein